jgi:hypothetical protein
MHALRTLAPFAAALGLVTAVPAAAGAPPAFAAGGAAPATVPSIVATHIARAEAALARAGDRADAGQASKVPRELKTAELQARYAWNAAAYVIKTTPATVVAAAVPDGTGAAGPAYAGREDTAFAALSLDHDLVATTVGLATQSGAKTTALRTSWVRAIALSQAARNNAVRSIHRLKAAGTFPTVMRGLVPLANDEVKQLNGRLKLTGFTGPLRKSLLRARTRALTTRKLVNRYWPPVPSG